MNVAELRSRYLEFFTARDHRHLPSAPLVPNDPTLLFTSAGMVQFKDVFAGRAKAKHPRVTTCQKCFRTTDIENVGRTAHHNTFFEMLGNFSFGDYFKQGAIELAWEFLTVELALPGDRLTAAVYEEDEDAYAIWRDTIGLPTDRIVRLGKEHNWWGPVGSSGPCGPDSEIHFDGGAELGCGPDCRGAACDCNRFNEIWNLVFIQYDQREDGELVPLKRACIDTGMGLERTTAVLQSAPTVYDIDVFRPITEAIEAAMPRSFAKTDAVYRNAIADHMRASLFLLADGVMPGNERQGYVFRRILRRAIRASEKLELASGALPGFVEAVIDSLGDVYPEIVDVRDLGVLLIGREEETFRRTLREGERRLVKRLDQLKRDGQGVLPGETAFELTDTYGFPLEMIEEIAAEQGVTIDLEGFERALHAQRKRSRKTVRADVAVSATVGRRVVRTTPFLGHRTLEADVEVLSFNPADLQVVFAKTPFYAQAGGQVGDTGVVKNLTRDFDVPITNTTRNEEEETLHHIADAGLVFEKGDRCQLIVDADRRRRIERNHTATHLLHAALRDVLGAHVKQAGSLVNDEELRFDFSHFEKLSADQIARVEDFANAAVLADLEVTTREMSLEEAQSTDAIGLFDEEYRGKDVVRVVSTGDVSRELCGGTHVRRSGEIGLIKIVSEESIASGVRRIRAVTGDRVLGRLRELDGLVRQIREAAGDDVYILGCGCPLGPAIGLVDAMRVSQDVDIRWKIPVMDTVQGVPTGPGAGNCLKNNLARALMHGRLWANDPDCVVLRQARG
ncbi:alanine--tRNA ligase, partial [Candidatus Bipolaricaulota bacterium]|nr:alanine--tRNA ligase [Candidatus Bipolaricaulota bacterium]